MAELLPTRWEHIGGVIILRLSREQWEYRREIGAAYAKALGATAVLARVGPISGPFREPEVERIWGDSAVTVHVENGVKFCLDAESIMFSAGNLRERLRMASTPEAGETVVDLFAGVGYFALPMALRSRAARVVACEVNPAAFRYLCEGQRLNRAWRLEPLLGDCTDVAPRRVADRVVMGFLDGARYLPLAMQVLRHGGGTVHYHEACPDERKERPEQHVSAAAREAGFRVARSRKFRLKSYAPGVGHWIIDARLER